MVILLEPLVPWLCSVGNLLTNVSPKNYYFLWDFYILFRTCNIIPAFCLKVEKKTLRKFDSFLIIKTNEMHLFLKVYFGMELYMEVPS